MQFTRSRHQQRFAYAASIAAFTLFFVACGSSTGPIAVPAPTVIDVGLQSATIPATVQRSLSNPLGELTTVTLETAGGPVAFDPAAFPMQVAANSSFTVPITFTPEGPGPAAAEHVLVFRGGGETERRVFELRATGEPIPWQVNPEPADFGFVLPGEESELTLQLTNRSLNSPVTYTEIAPPLQGIELVGDPLPLTLLPGVPATIDLRFAPPEKRDYSGPLRIGAQDDPGGPLFIPLIARGTGAGEQIVEFDPQVTTNGLTPLLTVSVPADAVSLTVEATGTAGELLGLGHLEGPNGEIYENTFGTGPHPWFESRGAFATHIPSGDTAALRLVPGGGDYKFRMMKLAGGTGVLQVRAIIERRPNATESQAVLPLNVFWANGLPQTAASAPTDAQWQALLQAVGPIFASRGITIGDIDHYDITDPALDDPRQADAPALFARGSIATATRLNLFMVRTVENGLLLGLSGAIGGPKIKGQSSSGVVVGLVGPTNQTLAVGIAHEICHYLGLWHTVEGNGVHDVLNDTPNCPVFGTNGVCSVEGGGLLMHWEAVGGTALSLTQGLIARRHALMEPTPADLNSKPQVWPDPPELSEETKAELRALGAWCGTCSKRKGR